MKKIILATALFALLQSCGNNAGESGVVDDGMRPADSNGGLPDDTTYPLHGNTDSTTGEHRVDTEKRGDSM
jgi:hypothetical protein